jgi:hypothetical protein
MCATPQAFGVRRTFPVPRGAQRWTVRVSDAARRRRIRADGGLFTFGLFTILRSAIKISITEQSNRTIPVTIFPRRAFYG